MLNEWDFIGVGLGHPVPQARLADAEILRQCGDRFVAQTRKLNRPPAELWWVWCRHRDILPDGTGHLTLGVRATGSSSADVSQPVGSSGYDARCDALAEVQM